MATLQGHPVDRPAVNFYEIGGFVADPDDPDPYNVYHSPNWRPLLRLALKQTDVIRLMSPVRPRSVAPSGSVHGQICDRYFRQQTWEQGDCRWPKMTLTVAGRTMTQVPQRRRDQDTVWTTEHLLKSAEDVKAYQELPDQAFAKCIDVSPLLVEETRLGAVES